MCSIWRRGDPLDLESAFDTVFSKALKQSFPFDLYGEKTDTTVVNLKKGRIEKCMRLENGGISMRINRKGKVGFAGQSLGAVDAASLMKSASVPEDSTSPVDPVEVDFPVIGSGTVAGMYDPALVQVPFETLEDIVCALASGAEHDSIASLEGYINTLAKEWIIGNSQGEKQTVRETYIKVFVETRARLLFKRSMNMEYQDGRALDNIEAELLGESCAEKAIRGLKSTKMVEENLPVVLGPAVVSNILYNFTGGMLHAENILKNVSCLREDRPLGCMTLIDDGTIPGGIRSSPIDTEGVKRERRVLIEEGEIRGYLHNLVSSSRFGIQATGNGCRPSYIEKPAIGPSNVILKPGDVTSQEIIENIKRGIYIALSFNVPNLTDGIFFLTAQNAFWIKNGEISEAVQVPALETNIYQFTDSFEAVSKDVSVLNGVWSPTVHLSPMRVFPSPITYAGGSPW